MGKSLVDNIESLWEDAQNHDVLGLSDMDSVSKEARKHVEEHHPEIDHSELKSIIIMRCMRCGVDATLSIYQNGILNIFCAKCDVVVARLLIGEHPTEWNAEALR